jgi:hypothetical protein
MRSPPRTAPDHRQRRRLRCPAGTGPCNIGKVFEIGDSCTLDWYAGRHHPRQRQARHPLNTVNLRAGSFDRAERARPGPWQAGRRRATGRLHHHHDDGRGQHPEARASGRHRRVRQRPRRPVIINAGGSITVSGDIISEQHHHLGRQQHHLAALDRRRHHERHHGTISAQGGDYSTGSFIDITASGRVDLGAT